MPENNFVGREDYLGVLKGELERVERTGCGRLVFARGRRRVGKSRLVEEFLRRTGAPHVFFTASRQPIARELQLFAEEVANSDLPAAAAAGGERENSRDNRWTARSAERRSVRC